MSVKTYTDLVTSEHKNKPKFQAMMEASLGPIVRIQDLVKSFPALFDVDDAVGIWLDTVGLWVGVSRFVSTPLTGIYFEWDGTAMVGWNSGIWQGEFSPTSGLTELPDDVYRTLIKAKIAANSWDGSIPNAYDIWETVFTNNIIVIQDNQDMTMTIGIVGPPLDALTQALIIGGYIPLKPEGVGVNFYAIPVDDAPIFAWDSLPDGLGMAGWDVGSWANLIEPA